MKYLCIILLIVTFISIDGIISKPKGKVFFDIKKPVAVKVGEVFNIKLRANHTTGYEWMLTEELDNAIIEFVDKEYISNKAPKGMTGVGGYEIWRFKALKKGTMDLKMKEARPWDPSGPVSVSLAFKVVVN